MLPRAAASNSRTSAISRLGELPEHVVVAGRGVVASDVRVQGTHQAAVDVNPAADTLAVLPAGAGGAARGLVAGNVYVVEEHGGNIEDAATAPADAAVAARPAGAARGLVPREGAAAEGDRPVGANGLVSAALAEAAVSAGAGGAARGLVADECAVADEEAAEGATAGQPGTGPDRAGLALAAVGAGPACAARGLVAGKGTGADVDQGGAGRGVGEQQAAAVAVAADPTGVAGAARGRVVGDGTMAQEERGPAAIKKSTAMAVGILRHKHAPGTAVGLVVAQRTVADAEEGRPVNALAGDGAAVGDAAAGAGAVVAADRLIVGESTVADDERGVEVVDGAARALAAGDAGAAVAADRLVVAEHTVGDGEQSALRVEDGAAPGVVAVAALGLVGRQGAVVDDQGAGVVDSAAVFGVAVVDGQTGEQGGDAAADLEDPALVLAADGHQLRAGAADLQVVGDIELATGGDRAVRLAGEQDPVGAGLFVGVLDRLPQRSGAAVREVLDQECSRHGPVFQGLQARREGQSSVLFRTALSVTPGALGVRFLTAKERG